MKLLCYFGLHTWQLIATYEKEYIWVGRNRVTALTKRCKCCDVQFDYQEIKMFVKLHLYNGGVLVLRRKDILSVAKIPINKCCIVAVVSVYDRAKCG